jgi:hypothetical protein
VVLELVGKLGVESVDAGLWIDQAMKRGRGRDFAFALARRGE